MKELRQTIRGLWKRPGFTAVVVLTLALGIGANTTVFSVVNTVLLRPLPFRDSGKLVTLWEKSPRQGYEQNPPAAGNYVDWRDQNKVFTQMAVYSSRQFSLSFGDQPERIGGAAVSASLFDVLGVAPTRGRAFTADEEKPESSQVVVISHGFWQRRLAGDPTPEGKTLTLEGKPHTILGVMPEGFQFPGGSGTVLQVFTPAPAEVWVPLVLDAETLRQRSSHSLNVIARLKPDVSVAQATSEMDAIQQRIEQQYPTFFVGSHVNIVPLTEQVIGSVRRPVLILWGAVVLVLLIGCANIANLMLVRSASRRKDIAVRAALGARRGQIIRQLLTESLVLSLAGGIAGTLLAIWSVRALAAVLPNSFPRHDEIAIDTSVLLFTLVISILTAVFFGLAPALQSTRVDLTEALKAGGRSAAEGWQSHRLRSVLVTAELALTLMLLIGAALMIQSFIHLQSVPPGFNKDQLLTVELSLPVNNYSRPQRAAFFKELVERTKAVPGIQTVAAAKHLPLSGGNMNFAVDVETRPFPAGKSPGADCRFVTPDYFSALAIPLIKGRYFQNGDDAPAPPVVVINEAMARRYFPNEEPLGQRLRLGINGFSGQIVGVVGDVKHVALDARANEEVYVPYAQGPFWTDMTLIARTSSDDPLRIAGAVRNEIRNIDKQVTVGKVRTLDAIASESIAQPRFRTLLLAVFGLVALLLAIIGVYGVMSYSVAQRTHEIGVRMALGAQVSDVRNLMLKRGLTLAVFGTALGLAGAFAVTRLMSSLLFGLEPTDARTFIAIPLVLLVAAFLACYLPARRATKVDPLVALRYE